ncbi:LemA family protein [Kutzneria buriramensis]|uniref:LemA protein n=1 Tax=Kutzneria buriramensis TaxID=1045776 RepID=A0A3E0I914_9PSEU|nr:LemA family protein [Kutzneria buriramensis]REH55016.1 LemA protein [Kutzneria buriramensis]
MVAALCVVAVLLLIVLGAALSHRRFVVQRTVVQRLWRQVDDELQRRHDLIGGLVAVTKAGGVNVSTIVQARSQAMASRGAGPVAQGVAEQVLNEELTGFLAGVPEGLRAGRDFGLLWERMGESEERVAAQARAYNDSVHTLNNRIVAFPSNIVAGATKVARAQYFLPGGRTR